MLKEIKGCRHIYHILLHVKDDNLNRLCDRWHENGISFDIKHMQQYFKTIFRCNIHTTIRYFQYRVLNRILYLNKDLEKIKIISDSSCSFCEKEEEDVVHFFYLCYVTKMIWSRLTDWLYNLTGCRIELSLIHVLFGFTEKRNDVLYNNLD